MSPRREGHTDVLGFEGLLAAKEIVVFCGSGGVGKTSCAAAAGAMAASQLGGKVLVLTVDPARRLATALGLEGIGNVEREVPPELFMEAGHEPRGRLYAAMLDTKRSWDELVHRHAPDEETAYKILENPLYHNITARFVNAHEYIAMERLYELHQTGQWDLIIVDTPPSRSAIDFLEAPTRMAEFFGGRFLKLITLPYRAGGRVGARVLDVAARPFYRLADRVLGSDFMQRLGEFFLYFQSMYDGFVERAEEVERLLHDRRTTFAVVTTPEAAPLREAEFFCEKLDEFGFDLGALVLNRVLPDYLRDPAGAEAAEVLRHPRALAEKLADEFPDLLTPDITESVLGTISDNFQNFSLVAMREAEEKRRLGTAVGAIVQIPHLDHDVADLDGLLEIGAAMFERGAGATTKGSAPLRP
ncbi:MAG: ArsA family ATPase [Acidimicrobiia bacterium]|nr:ArsA family ATPase [Acidimicrobiia bacterium]